MKNAVLFVRGAYRKEHLSFYKRLCRARTKVAVDGGYAFFKKTGLVPDLIIGDLDSAKGLPRKLHSRTTVVTFPVKKDKTDSQLALEYCIEQGARRIDIVMPSVGEMDHYFGNVFLLTASNVARWVEQGGRVRIVNAAFELHYLKNRKLTLRDCTGDTVSVIPLSRRVVLTCSGTEYNVKSAAVSRGQSRPMRNRITAKRAVFSIDGEALLFHMFSSRR